MEESESINLIIETQWFDIIKEHLEMGLTVTNSLLGPLFRLEEEDILTIMMMNFQEHSSFGPPLLRTLISKNQISVFYNS